MTDPIPLSIRPVIRQLVVSLVIACVLWRLGRGSLATPPIDSWSDFRQWLAARSTAVAAVATVRACAAVAACYLAVASTLSIIAHVTTSKAVARLARSFVPRSMRPLVYVAFGAGVATAGASVLVPRANAPTQLATVTLHPPSDATATMYVVAGATPASTVAPTATPTVAPTAAISSVDVAPPELLVDAPPTAAGPEPAAPAPIVAPRSWTIERGDHLWGVAFETLADSWRRPPTDMEVVPYWRALIERNRARLVDPGNADYVLPGQVFELPDVPARP